MTAYSILNSIQPAAYWASKAGIDVYLFLICLRVTCTWSRVYSKNPLLTIISRITLPYLKIFYRFIPSVNGFDFAALIALLLLEALKITGFFWYEAGGIPPLLGVSVLAFAQLFKQFVDIISLMFLMVILFNMTAWLQPTITPALEIAFKITRPVLNIFARFLPLIAGVDCSGVMAFMTLSIVTNFIAMPLMHTGTMLINMGGV